MPNFLDFLRLQNIFKPPSTIMGNDLPSQGGIMGSMELPRPAVPFPSTGGGFRDMFNPRKFPFESVDFGGTTPLQTNTSIPSPVTESPGDKISRRMMELYTPQTKSTEEFNRMIGEYPQWERPGMLRTIAAALSAFGPGGMSMGMKVLTDPHERRLEEWKNKIGPAQQSANLERQENVNERTLAYQTISQQLKAEADEERAKNNEVNARIRQQRADVYQFKAQNPNLRFDFSGPTVKVANPVTGQVTDTGIETGAMSDTDKMMLQQSQSLERIQATGEQSRETENVRQVGRETIGETRGWQVSNIPDPNDPSKQIAVKINQVTGEVVPITLGGKPTGPVSRGTTTSGTNRGELPTQTKVRQFNAARQLVSSRPDLAPFIKLGTNDFTITGPSDGGFFSRGPTKQQHDEIVKRIYGEAPPINQPGRTGSPTVPQIDRSKIPQGRIPVMDKDGKVFTIPANQLEQAKQQGYTEVP